MSAAVSVVAKSDPMTEVREIRREAERYAECATLALDRIEMHAGVLVATPGDVRRVREQLLLCRASLDNMAVSLRELRAEAEPAIHSAAAAVFPESPASRRRAKAGRPAATRKAG